MVAKITSPHSIKRALNYNEQKVLKGNAECIYSGNYLKDASELDFHEKLNRFKDLIDLNERAQKTNTLHISLNFSAGENLDKEKLIMIANSYMEKIGFGKQPYLVYEHHDAGHPHIHIVTTNIEADGKRINTYNIGRNQSEKARKEIEEKFELQKANGKIKNESAKIQAVDVQKVLYGNSETKRAITNVLDAVINQYKYTSLAELNAILKQYNVIADRGKEDGITYNSKGLLFKVLDENGKKVGVPIKASSIYSQPILSNLEKKFEENEIKRQPDKQKLKIALDIHLVKNPRSLDELIKALQKENIHVVLRQNDKGLIYGVTFIDTRTKSVFNGSDLGKQYSAAALQEKLSKNNQQTNDNKETITATKQKTSKEEKRENGQETKKEKTEVRTIYKEDLLQLMMKQERNEARMPHQLLQKKKRKKKRNLGL